MRKQQKKQAEELLAQMELAHEQIRKDIEQKNIAAAIGLLGDCQDAAISLGTMIEGTEGEGHPTVILLEEYCELVYGVHEDLAGGNEASANKVYKILKQKLVKVFNSVQHDIKIRLEAVFLPYKASMWDSLESVWEAADADPDCDAYVIPIPYYEKNPDGSLGTEHYEGNEYPANVPITRYDEFDFEAHRPDMIYIHNPYDSYNFVTSVHPYFYSEHLKQFTDCLVYIPYYATAGGMSEAQSLCSAYLHADYIVIQAENFRRFFDKDLPDEKFLPFGSPKFDSVIRKCQNPPEPPAVWKKKMQGRRVYFYNTSINGMLADTDAFLKKMKYVFDIFLGREDACLLWRPHPLLESTFESMRAEYKPVYDSLKRWFLEADIGILDETTDMENTIALSDVYIGDGGTSVISMFGVTGKPIFIFNNYLHTLPEKDDWRGERMNLQFNALGDNRYQIIGNDQLWFSEKNDYHYRFCLDLGTGYSAGGHYMRAMEIDGKIYVIPRSVQNMLVIEDKKIRKVEFQTVNTPGPAFISYSYLDDHKYLFLIPGRYPFLIRYHLHTGKIDYIEDVQPFYMRQVENEWKLGGYWSYDNEILFASPEDGQILSLNRETLERKKYCVSAMDGIGIQSFSRCGDEEELWLLPMKGLKIIRWNPRTGEKREYSDVPENFKVVRYPFETESDEHPFISIVFFREYGSKLALIQPNWGNMILSLDVEADEIKEWELPMGFVNRGKNGYFRTGSVGCFVITMEQLGKPDCRFWYAPERKLYDINVFTGEYKEVEIEFDYNDLLEHEPGFYEESEWLQYCLKENAFNSLKDLLDDKITGNPFDRERQLRDYAKVNANTEGTCGQNVYSYVKGKLL